MSCKTKYRGAIAILLVCGCGRIGFDAHGSDKMADAMEEADATIPDGALYISPTGDDSGDGSREAPFHSFSFALSQLGPGDTLLALPGTYGMSSGTGVLNVDCRSEGLACNGAPCANGEAGSPIVIRSLEPRRAHLAAEPTNDSATISLRSCQNYEVADFAVTGIDDASIEKATTLLLRSSGIVLRGNLLSKSNRMQNGHLIEVTSSSEVLLEENELYDFHRAAIISYESSNVTARRNYIGARSYPDVVGGYTSSNPTSGDVALSCSHSAACRFENNISEGATGFGVIVHAGLPGSTLPGAGDNAQIIGNIIFEANFGMFIASGCDAAAVCEDALVVTSPKLQDNLTLNSVVRNLSIRGARDVVLDHHTSLGSDIAVDLNDENASLDASVAITNTLAVASVGSSISVQEQAAWSIDYSNGFGTAVAFSTNGDTTGLGMNNSTIAPQLAGCVHRIPQSSPMSGLGRDGTDIGANIVYRTEDGQQTGTLLWDASTGEFPCGAIVPSVNDSGIVCSSVHSRLGIGTSCAVH